MRLSRLSPFKQTWLVPTSQTSREHMTRALVSKTMTWSLTCSWHHQSGTVGSVLWMASPPRLPWAGQSVWPQWALCFPLMSSLRAKVLLDSTGTREGSFAACQRGADGLLGCSLSLSLSHSGGTLSFLLWVISLQGKWVQQGEVLIAFRFCPFIYLRFICFFIPLSSVLHK